MQIVTATEFKKDMKHILEQSINTKQPVIIKRPHGKDMALITLAEYESLKETAYLLGEQANAQHLLQSMQQLKQDLVVKKQLKDLEE